MLYHSQYMCQKIGMMSDEEFFYVSSYGCLLARAALPTHYAKIMHFASAYLSMGTLAMQRAVHTVFYKQLLYKQGSTRQGKKLSKFSTGLKTAMPIEK